MNYDIVVADQTKVCAITVTLLVGIPRYIFRGRV